MKKISLSLLLILGICSGRWVLAQEDTASEVDKILAEIEEEPLASEETQTAGGEAESGGLPEGEAGVEESAETGEAPGAVAEEVTAPAEELEAVLNNGAEIRGAENPKSEIINLNYEDVDLADVVRIIAKTAEANIVIPDGMDEKVSANLNDVHWREALEVILGEKGYILVERNSGIYTITTRDKMATEPLQNETIDLQFITAEAALPAVQSMLVTSNATATVIPETSMLIITESPEQLQKIKGLLSRVDRPRRQVFIEAKFVELNDSAIQDLGINWQVLQGYTVRATGLSSEFERIETRSTQDAQVFTNGTTSTRTQTIDNTGVLDDTDVTTAARAQTDTLLQGRNFTNFDAASGTISTEPTLEQTVTKKAVLSADDFALTLSALQQLDGTRIVSNPKMLVANGETATIHVGRNEPNIRAVPQGENATTFAYVLDGFIEIGVKLEVTPVISTDRNITINIIPELSRLIGQKEVGEAGTSFPITQIRKINTEFAVESGKTVAIGGLTQTEDQEDVSKIPLLGDLPIIGKYLFTHTSTRQVQDEIIIFVTVDATHTEDMNDRDGIPDHGTLIHTWLDHQRALKEQKGVDVVIEAEKDGM